MTSPSGITTGGSEGNRLRAPARRGLDAHRSNILFLRSAEITLREQGQSIATTDQTYMQTKFPHTTDIVYFEVKSLIVFDKQFIVKPGLFPKKIDGTIKGRSFSE